MVQSSETAFFWEDEFSLQHGHFSSRNLELSPEDGTSKICFQLTVPNKKKKKILKQVWSLSLFAHQGSHGQKTPGPLLSMKYWLFHRDPFNGLVWSLYNWVV